MAVNTVSTKRCFRDEHDSSLTDAEKFVEDETKAKNAFAQKAWRERLKTDPEKYKQFRKADSERVKAIRYNLTDEKRKQYNERTRLRMIKYRQKKKEEGMKESKRSVTRATCEKQRKKWREEKRQQREAMSSQKRRRINERRRKLYAEKKVKSNSKVPDKENMNSSSTATFKSDGARRQAIHRTLKILPKDPNKFVEVVTNIIHKTTPKRKAALSQKCLISPQSKKRLEFYDCNVMKSKEKLKEIKERRSKKDNRLRYLLHQAAAIKCKGIKGVHLKQLGFSRKVLSKVSGVDDIMEIQRKKRSDAMPKEDLEKVTNFFHQSDVSREMPNPRQVNKAMCPRKTLDGSLVNSYQKFQEQNPDVKISYSKFVKCRPTNVKPAAYTKYNQCLCEYCTNVDLKISSLVRFCSAHHIEPVCKDRYEASRLTLCPKEGEYYRKECIDRKCEECGVSNLAKTTKAVEVLRQHGLSDIRWQSWVMDEITKIVKGKEVKKRQMTQKVHTTTVQELVEELTNSMKEFSKHLFNAQWQARQFEALKVSIPHKWVLLCSDFGENYICRQQDEAQSAHWSYDQVTLHPIVAYYRCQECEEPMHESFIFVSEDHKHDHHAVHHFTKLVNEILLSRGFAIETQIQFSDGAPTQYKSKINFVDMSLCQEELGFHVEKHFFGSRHGKGPCDGEVGVLKRCIITGVKTRKAMIRNAMEFYEYGKSQLSLPKEDTNQHIHQKRTFIFVKDGEIDRERNDRLANIKAVKDTRMTHCFRPVAPYVITSRERSCFCDVCRCINGTCEEKCSNELLTGNWVVQNISIKRRTRPDGAKRTVTEAENEDVGSEDGDITDGQNEVNTNEGEKGDNGMVNVNRDDITDNLGNTESLQDIQHEDNTVGQMVYDLESAVNISGLSDIIADRLNPDTEPVDLSDLSGMLEFDEKMDVFVAEGMGQTSSPQRESIIHSDQQTEYRQGQFVEAHLVSDKRKKRLYVAEIKEVCGGEYLLQFMQRKGDRFYWPSVDDFSWEPYDSIHRLLPIPVLSKQSSSRRQLFEF